MEGDNNIANNNPNPIVHRRRMANRDYTEFGIKIANYKLTFKVQNRASSAHGGQRNGNPEPDTRRMQSEERPQRSRRRPRANSSSSSIADSLRMLDLDSNAGSRRPIVQGATANTTNGNNSGTRLANWEFEGFYSPPLRTSTPSSGYSSAAVSRTSSFSSDAFNGSGASAGPANPLRSHAQARQSRLTSADDSAISDVYSTIDETSELTDPFDGDDQDGRKVSTLKKKTPSPKVVLVAARKVKVTTSKSMSSLLNDCQESLSSAMTSSVSSPAIAHQKTKSLLDPSALGKISSSQGQGHQKTKSSTSLDLPADIPPPLPPRISKCRPPARPPYPSSIVRAVQQITQPLDR